MVVVVDEMEGKIVLAVVVVAVAVADVKETVERYTCSYSATIGEE
jgi:hypothetical protein